MRYLGDMTRTCTSEFVFGPSDVQIRDEVDWVPDINLKRYRVTMLAQVRFYHGHSCRKD